ncbi:MAG: chromosome partitioning protein ParB [Thermoproteota archaeon]|nr:MAG: chromosome partitioning protein ParB [Candidatus Korarchaeota archaeon]
MELQKIIEYIEKCSHLPEKQRIEIYNSISIAIKKLVSDISDDPVLGVQLVPIEMIEANDYNPNRVATPEMELLRDSIEQDGITMPIVVYHNREDNKYVIVDGFHRSIVIKDLKRRYVPVSVIEKDICNRIASTIRHNRARGKHQTEMMASIVKMLLKLGWNDDKISKHIGMSKEELLRMKQVVKVSEILAAPEYSCSWGVKDGQDIPD